MNFKHDTHLSLSKQLNNTRPHNQAKYLRLSGSFSISQLQQQVQYKLRNIAQL